MPRKTLPLESRYGKWTVLQPQDASPKVDCICDCGTEKQVWRHQLRAGQSTSCGCVRREQLQERMQNAPWDYSLAPHKDPVVEVGSLHGRLEVIGEPKPTEPGKKHKMVPVRCSCGNELEVALWSLRSGSTKSCGCYKAENGRRRLSHAK